MLLLPMKKMNSRKISATIGYNLNTMCPQYESVNKNVGRLPLEPNKQP